MPNPYRDTPAARLVDDCLRSSGRTMAETASAVGIRPNHLSMIRNGAAAVPADRCGAVARGLGIEPGRLLSLCVESYPDNRSWRAAALAAGL